MNDFNARTPGLSEEAARRLLARAVALDAHHRDTVSLAELRAAAIEAGIDVAAFDGAVAELDSDAIASSPRVTRPSRWHHFANNVKAAFAFWVALTILTRLSHLIPYDWTVSAIRDGLAMGVGLWFAVRFQARIIQILLIGIGVARLSLFLVHLLFGIGAAQGGPTQFADLGAGLLGALAVALTGRSERRRDGSPASSGVSVGGLEPSSEAAEAATQAKPCEPRPFRLVRAPAVCPLCAQFAVPSLVQFAVPSWGPAGAGLP